MLSYRNNNTPYDHSLIFFPFAGGSGELYIPWFKYFSSNISCRYAMLKGSGRYLNECAFDNTENLVDSYIPEILTICDKPSSFLVIVWGD